MRLHEKHASLLGQLAVILLCSFPSFTAGTSDEEYALRELFNQALNTTHNLYAISEYFLPDHDASLICVAIKYNLTCKHEDPCSNLTSTVGKECTGKGYISSYLWTSFDTDTIAGDMLLHWALSGIRVLGFEWNENCRHSSHDAVKLILEIDTLPCVKDGRDVVHALEYVTTTIKAYAEVQGVPSDSQKRKYSGYATQWFYHTSASEGERLVNALAGLISLFSFLVMVTVGSKVYEKIDSLIQARKNLLYLYFWSFQLMAFVCCWGGLVYLVIAVDDKVTTYLFYTIYVAMFLDVFIALWIAWRRVDHHFPVPFVFGCCCHGCYSTFLPFVANFLANVFAIWNIFAFLTFLLYSLPSIVLAYYVFPSRSLIRLSFLEFAVIVILLATALFLYVTEKMCLTCFTKCNKYQVKRQALNSSINKSDVESRGSGKDSAEVDLPDVSDYPEAKDFQDGSVSANELALTVVQFLTSALFLVGITSLVMAIGVVVFKETSSENKSISGYLTVLPTIAVNVTLWMVQKQLLVPDELKSLSHGGAKRLEALLKARKHKKSQGSTDIVSSNEESAPIVGSGGANYSTLS